jgi:hypothetical protein
MSNYPINDNRYNELKLLYKFCKILHFIKECAEKDAKATGDEKFQGVLNQIKEQLERFVKELDALACKK